MTNPLLTTSEVQAGDLLATVDGAEYRAVIAVYKLNGAGTALSASVACPYCEKVCQDRRGLAGHIRFKHNEVQHERASLE